MNSFITQVEVTDSQATRIGAGTCRALLKDFKHEMDGWVAA
jgi:hypothetical protein